MYKRKNGIYTIIESEAKLIKYDIIMLINMYNSDLFLKIKSNNLISSSINLNITIKLKIIIPQNKFIITNKILEITC